MVGVLHAGDDAPEAEAGDGDPPVAEPVADPVDEAVAEPEGSEPEPRLAVASWAPNQHLQPDLGEAVLHLSDVLGMPVWVLIQNQANASLDPWVRQAFFKDRALLRATGPVALVIDSPGGSAQAAYQIGRMFQRHCGGFTAVVPRYAKSAATLLALGGNTILMGQDAELGPLDAQLFDIDTEQFGSALDEVQALERLSSASLDLIDQAMLLLLNRTGKKMDTILPIVTQFVSSSMAPLVDKIDTVHYTQRARILKVAEDYATRLLRIRFSPGDADRIARSLVNSYPEHAFVIDREEASGLLDLEPMEQSVEDAVCGLEDVLSAIHTTAIGMIIEPGTTGTDEAPPDGAQDTNEEVDGNEPNED